MDGLVQKICLGLGNSVGSVIEVLTQLLSYGFES